MAGLVLTLEPNERVLINGALLENGDKPAKIRVCDREARVLRCRDALRPEQVTTPVRRIYFAIQLLITGDLGPENTLDALRTECRALADIFDPILPGAMHTLGRMIDHENYHSALCHLRPLLELEDRLLGSEARDTSAAAA